MFMSQTARRRWLAALLLAALSFAMIGAKQAPQHEKFPPVIALPDGFQPEGITSGKGTTFYVGSIPTGAIFRGDIKTGKGSVFIPAQQGRSSIGMKYDARTGLLYVAGGATGNAYIYNAMTGANVATVRLTTSKSFINDLVITKQGVYFTDSSQPVIYLVPLAHTGQLPPNPTSQTISLSGDYKFTQGVINANGIVVTPDGKALIIVNTAEGALYNVNPATGVATRINLGGGSVVDGDGLLLLQGGILYVVQNRMDKIAVVKLTPNYLTGNIISTITSNLFHVPTTLARFGDSIYAVNARYDTPPTPATEYQVVHVPPR